MSDIEKKASTDGSAADQLEHVQTKEGHEHVFVRPTAQEEAAVIRKLDWRLLPLVFVLYSLSVLDRSNLGNARIAGMVCFASSQSTIVSVRTVLLTPTPQEDDIDLSGNRYNLLGTIFYIAYIISQ